MSDNRTPKIRPEDVLGGAPRRAPRRFSRRVILSVSIVALVAATGTLMYGLFHQPNSQAPKPADAAVNSSTEPPFDNLQNSYTPAPKPAPTAAAQPVQMAVRTEGGGQSGGNQQSTELTDDQKLALAAQSAGVFFQSAPAQGEDGDGLSDATPPAAGAGAGQIGADASQAARQGPAYGEASGSAPGGDPNLANADANNAFLSSQSTTGTTYAQPLQSPVSPYEVEAGSVIPAALLTKSISDLPGDLTAQVTENVYDSATGKYLLIPQGTRLYGRYSSLIAYGQTRSLIVWNRLILPNGKSETLGGMIGTDAEGASGMTGDVNRHNLAFMGALAVATLLSVGPAIADNLQSNGSNNTIVEEPAQYASSEGQSIGQQLVARELDRPNTITIYGGQTLRVLVNKDLILEPYAP